MTTPLQPGDIVDGKYRLTRRIGEGGMGTVFEGENVRIKRKVAIKVLHDHVATSPEFAQRFVREARASARIGSEHVCDVLDLGDLESGEKYIVMELLDGESMEQRLERDSRLDPKVLVPLGFEILEGLGAMHQVGVIHRDLKPANVFLCKTKSGGVSVKILDFGVAKVEASDEDPSGIHDMTSTGTMMGTPLYMSPEQARGARDVDGRTDLYAASVIMYEGLTGETPHQGASLHELLFKIVLDDPKPIKTLAPHVDDELAEIVMKGLSRDAENRFSSARQYQEALQAWGAKHDLTFQVTLPSEPPPLRKQTGGFPAAIIETAGQAMRTGNTPVSTNPGQGSKAPSDAVIAAASPVDVNAVTQPSVHPASPSNSRVPAVSATMPAGSAVEPAAKAGDTLLAGAEPPKKTASVTPAPKRASLASAAPAPPPSGTSKATIGIAVAVALAAAIIGVKLGSADSQPPTQPSATASTAVAPPPSSPSSGVATAPSVTPPAPSSASLTEPAPSVSVPTAPATQPLVVPPPKPSAAPKVTPSAPAPAVSGRIISVDAGF